MKTNTATKSLLIIIAGPTASGKTNLAIEIAKHFHTEILSADSRQLYKEISIGTAKPTIDELSQVKHHFINHISIHQNYDVGIYRTEALAILNQLFESHNIAVMVGGTGLYIKAVVDGLDEFPAIDIATKNIVRQEFEHHGLQWLQDEIKKSDPTYFNNVDINNPMRLMRALEVCRASGKPYSSFLSKPKNELPFDVLKIAIDINKDELYQRINQRVLMMMQEGLEEEVRNVFDKKHLQALQTVGYQEMFDYFEHKISREKAIELIQQNTRHYAKRQLTWLRKVTDINWCKPDAASVIELVEKKLNQ